MFGLNRNLGLSASRIACFRSSPFYFGSSFFGAFGRRVRMRAPELCPQSSKVNPMNWLFLRRMALTWRTGAQPLRFDHLLHLGTGYPVVPCSASDTLNSTKVVRKLASGLHLLVKQAGGMCRKAARAGLFWRSVACTIIWSRFLMRSHPKCIKCSVKPFDQLL